MQIFELTQSKKIKLNELAPSSPPPKKNFGTSVGPGVQPQYTATPRIKTTPTPGAAPRLPAPTTAPGALTTTAPAPKLQTIDAPPQLTGPKTTAQKQLGTDYDSNVVDVEARPKTKTSAQQSALPAPAQRLALPAPTAPAPAPVSAPTAQPAPTAAAYNQPTYNVPLATAPDTKTTMPTNMSTTGAPVVNVTPATQKIEPEGHLAQFTKMLTRHNAEQAGVGYLINDNPTVILDKEGKITVDGQPYNANNSDHVKAYQTFVANGGKNVASTPKKPGAPEPGAAPAASGAKNLGFGFNTDTGQAFSSAEERTAAGEAGKLAAREFPATPAGAPKSASAASAPEAEPSGVELALKKLGYSPQGAAAMAAKVPPGMSEQDAIKLALSGKLRESLTWSRGFDPSRTLLEKIRQL